MKTRQVGTHLGHTIPLADGHPLCVVLLDERNGHGLPANDDIAQTTDVRLCKSGLVGHHFEHGGYPHKQAGSLRLEQPEYRPRIKFFHQAHIAAMVQKGRQQHIPASRMERRHTHNCSTLLIDNQTHSSINTIPEEHFMCIQCSFGEARRAGGIKQKYRMILLLGRKGDRIGGSFCRHPAQPGRKGFQRPVLRTGPKPLRLAESLKKFLLPNKQRRLAVAQDKIQLSSRKPVVERHQREARLLCSGKKRYILQTILCQYRDAVAFLQPVHSCQLAYQCSSESVERCIGQLSAGFIFFDSYFMRTVAGPAGGPIGLHGWWHSWLGEKLVRNYRLQSDSCRSKCEPPARTNEVKQIILLYFAFLPGIVERHRNAGRSCIAVLVHDGVRTIMRQLQ